MRTEDLLEVVDGLRFSMVTHHVPLPAGHLEYPVDCDELRHLRIRLDDESDDPASADAVIVFLPGAIAGARSLQPVGRNTIRSLRAAGIRAEFWAIDRRANALEDHSPIEIALAEGDYRLPFDYYYRGAKVGGRRFGGFYRDRELGFLAEFGMARTVGDLHAILSAELPDADIRADRVFLGGHSLGGIQAGAYAAWDFDGRPGHEQIAGLIALDTVTHLDPLRLRERGLIGKGARRAVRVLERAPIAMRRNLIPRSTAVMKGGWGNAEMFAVLAGIAAAATMAPEEESDILHRLPENATTRIAIRASTARTWREFLTGRPDYRNLRLTNLALLGLLGSAHTSVNLAILSMSCGTLDSAAVAPRSFPLPFEASGLPGLRGLYQAGLGTQPRYSPTSFDELYHWRGFDRCGAQDAPAQFSKSGVPASTAAGEVVDITELAKVLAGGRLNVFEDYFPARQSIDAAAVFGGCRTGSLAPIRHEAGAARLPHLNLMGASSFTNVIAGLGVYPENTRWLPGYLHCDLALGADPRADGTPEPVAAALSEFVVANLPAQRIAS
ncbi:hypothetical protein [Nocardia sp. NPDC052566]|uniref:hypothetical protein n=1 Tax=Nocardia sp. NPDC052566 TaxID=3364330 RepID=UPI0037CB8B81